MGVAADNVPFKATVFEGTDDLPDSIQPSLKAFLEFQENFDDGDKPFTHEGWVYDGGWDDATDKIVADYLIKDGRKVYYINENEYSAGGGETTTFFANDQSDLKKFLKEWKLIPLYNEGIEENAIVLCFE